MAACLSLAGLVGLYWGMLGSQTGVLRGATEVRGKKTGRSGLLLPI